MTDSAMAPAVAQPPFAGRRVRRVEDARLLTGHGTFVDDIQRPGMLHACFVRSPFARALINGIDVSAALDLPGVHAVYTAADLNPEVYEAWYSSYGPKVPDTPRPPLTADEVRFVGDPVALVIAPVRRWRFRSPAGRCCKAGSERPRTGSSGRASPTRRRTRASGAGACGARRDLADVHPAGSPLA
jgi:xanthine dehydrogenase molybdopterin-binding subunit B